MAAVDEPGAVAGRQLYLNIRPRDDATFDNYVVQSRAVAVRAAIDAPRERMVFIHGPDDGGKSHLLQAACHAADGAAVYLPLAAVAELSPDALLEGIDCVDLVCLDDLQGVLGDSVWERALFNLYNGAERSRARVLISANAPPGALAVALPDLRSRLAAMLVCAMPAPDENDRLEILVARAAKRGLSMSAEVARYISHRAGRSLRDLMRVLEELDNASLTHQRALSIPFVREVMAWPAREQNAQAR